MNNAIKKGIEGKNLKIKLICILMKYKTLSKRRRRTKDVWTDRKLRGDVRMQK